LSAGLRIALVGATGMLGGEVLSVMEEEALPVAELALYAGERSLGAEIEFMGQSLPVEVDVPQLRSTDLLVVCTHTGPALELVREALRAEVPCLDCSGSLMASSDVPLVVADLGAHDQIQTAPVITAPTGAALSCALVLSALQRAAGLERVVGTVLHSASAAGRRGIADLSDQTVALLNQQASADSTVFPFPLAFDCHPHGPEEAKDDLAPSESRIRTALHRLLGPDVGVALTSVQVPAFAGEASALAVELSEPLPVEKAIRVLDSAPGVEVWQEDAPGTRDPVGRDVVLVGRVRTDDSLPTPGTGLLIWAAADPVRLAASNAVKLMRARFGLD
jgi:aspartate-semialdehyde dehydrogenase